MKHFLKISALNSTTPSMYRKNKVKNFARAFFKTKKKGSHRITETFGLGPIYSFKFVSLTLIEFATFIKKIKKYKSFLIVF
jgi:hypothetical protein